MLVSNVCASEIECVLVATIRILLSRARSETEDNQPTTRTKMFENHLFVSNIAHNAYVVVVDAVHVFDVKSELSLLNAIVYCVLHVSNKYLNKRFSASCLLFFLSCYSLTSLRQMLSNNGNMRVWANALVVTGIIVI